VPTAHRKTGPDVISIFKHTRLCRDSMLCWGKQRTGKRPITHIYILLDQMTQTGERRWRTSSRSRGYWGKGGKEKRNTDSNGDQLTRAIAPSLYERRAYNGPGSRGRKRLDQRPNVDYMRAGRAGERQTGGHEKQLGEGGGGSGGSDSKTKGPGRRGKKLERDE